MKILTSILFLNRLNYIFININSMLSSNVLQEYCQNELFQPNCAKDEIIVMTKAFYGRMEIGKCIKEIEKEYENNPRFLGCFSDVLFIMEEKCSGKQSCDVSILDVDLQSTSPCIKDLKTYLKASYYCAKAQEENDQCLFQASNHFPINLKIDILKTSATNNLNKNHCGSNTNPWKIEAPQGQHLNITLINLHSSNMSNSNSVRTGKNNQNINVIMKSNCEIMFHIKERSKEKEILCYSEYIKIRNIYKSEGNSVEIELLTSGNNNLKPFLLEYGAYGCPDLIPAGDAWMKRYNDVITIGCYTSRQTWKLKCNGQHWHGVIGNCSMTDWKEQSKTKIFLENEEHIENQSKIQMLWVMAISGIVLALCLLIITIGYTCYKRSKSQKYSKENDSVILPNSINVSNQIYLDYLGKNVSKFLDIDSSTNDNKMELHQKETLINKQNDSAYYVLEQ